LKKKEFFFISDVKKWFIFRVFCIKFTHYVRIGAKILVPAEMTAEFRIKLQK